MKFGQVIDSRGIYFWEIFIIWKTGPKPMLFIIYQPITFNQKPTRMTFVTSNTFEGVHSGDQIY